MHKKLVPHDLNHVRLLRQKQDILMGLFINIWILSVHISHCTSCIFCRKARLINLCLATVQTKFEWCKTKRRLLPATVWKTGWHQMQLMFIHAGWICLFIEEWTWPNCDEINQRRMHKADHPLFAWCNDCLQLETLYSRDTIGWNFYWVEIFKVAFYLHVEIKFQGNVYSSTVFLAEGR